MATVEENVVEFLIRIGQLRNSELDFQRIPMSAESELMNKVRQGKYKEIKISPFSKMNGNLGQMAGDELTQYTYMVVAAITLFSRIAVEEGVMPDTAFDLSDALLYYLSHCKTMDDIYETYKTSASMFAKQISKTKGTKQSYQIGRVQNYISRNIYKKITLGQIADYVGLTTNYLCAMFSRQMGISLHNYIQKEKITVASDLLCHTDRSVSDISSYMGFQSQSNFSAVFKKWTGMTPSEYREKQFREVF